MSAPIPAAVRAALKQSWDDCTPDEKAAWRAAPHSDREVLRDHIRAVATQMRGHAESMPRVAGLGQICPAKLLCILADKLEGLK